MNHNVRVSAKAFQYQYIKDSFTHSLRIHTIIAEFQKNYNYLTEKVQIARKTDFYKTKHILIF